MTAQSLLSLLAEAAAEPRFIAAVGIAALAGLVRGFTGFGSALIYMPLISAVYSPRLAAPTLLLDRHHLCPALRSASDAGLQLARSGAGVACRRGGVAARRHGAGLGRSAQAALVHRALVLIALVVLVSGWRYRGRPTLAASFGVGALAGFGAGAVQIGAPPLLVFWLGGANKAATVRANIMVYFIAQGALSFLLYAFSGVVTRRQLFCRCCSAAVCRCFGGSAPIGFTARAMRSTAASPM